MATLFREQSGRLYKLNERLARYWVPTSVTARGNTELQTSTGLPTVRAIWFSPFANTHGREPCVKPWETTLTQPLHKIGDPLKYAARVFDEFSPLCNELPDEWPHRIQRKFGQIGRASCRERVSK